MSTNDKSEVGNPQLWCFLPLSILLVTGTSVNHFESMKNAISLRNCVQVSNLMCPAFASVLTAHVLPRSQCMFSYPVIGNLTSETVILLLTQKFFPMEDCTISPEIL